MRSILELWHVIIGCQINMHHFPKDIKGRDMKREKSPWKGATLESYKNISISSKMMGKKLGMLTIPGTIEKKGITWEKILESTVTDFLIKVK